ncbi:MAG: RHS repeat-associated core domain-containing protein, partial [Aristaeellaceae bacterium]
STGTTNYTLHGKNIVHMTQGSNELHFFYDAQNKPAVVVYNGSPYSYVKNLQGDIVAILDSNKNVVVSYVYDAWGRPISCLGTMANTLGKINPFRYRGYVYDEETELYYLQSRYFSTACCRFISVDGLIDATRLLSLNQFAYCLNQPVNLSDPTGFAAPDDFDDDLDHNSPCTDSLAGGGGYLWDSFRRSLQAATDGLNMAMGKRNLPSLEKHHLLSNKNRKYTPQYEDVVNRYEMSLDDERNIVELPDHKGRHTNAYHDYMLDMLTELDSIANGSNELFYEGFDILKRFIVDNPWLPYAK